MQSFGVGFNVLKSGTNNAHRAAINELKICFKVNYAYALDKAWSSLHKGLTEPHATK